MRRIHERLAGVIIECLPWDDFLRRYDSADTLFYLDPPYHGSEDDYGIVFTRADFAAVAAALARIKGRFLLSINDVPETRTAFGAFRIESVETRYTIAGGRWADAGELIVTGPRADDPVWDGSAGRLI